MTARERHRLWLISLVAALSFVAVTMSRPLVPLYADALHASPARIGAVVAAFALLPLFLAIPAGALVDRLGARPLLIVGSLGMAAALACVDLRPGLAALALSQVLAGIGQLLVVVASQTAATHTGNEHHEGALGFYTTLISAGQLLGPLLGGRAADALGYAPAFGLAALVGLLPALLAFFTPAGTGPVRAQSPLERGTIRRVLSHKAVLIAMLSSFSVIFALGVRQAFFPVFVQNVGYSATVVGLLLSVRALASMLARWVMARLVAWSGGRYRLLIGSMLVGALALGLTPLTRDLALLLAVSVALGAATGLTQPLSMLVVAQTVDDGTRGLAMGTRLTGNRLAQLTNPLLFGFVAEWAGLEMAFVAGGLVLLGATALLLRLPNPFKEERESAAVAAPL